MLFALTGSSAVGKTAVVAELTGCHDDLDIHDFDEIGVPSDADSRWRQQAAETWLRRALARQADGRHTLVAGPSPLGEWLAAPSATRLDGMPRACST